MLLASSEEIARAETVRGLVYGNPFVPERIVLEKELLGAAFAPAESVWNWRTSLDGDRPNLEALRAVVSRIASDIQTRVAAGDRPDERERPLIEAVLLHHFYYRYRDQMLSLVGARGDGLAAPFYEDFAREVARFRPLTGHPLFDDPPHAFACFFQVLRAFVNVYTYIVGGSAPIARLRADVWRSIFTRDLERYTRGLFTRMMDVPTLVLGPTGTGKELVARAIALSGYLPFDAKAKRFVNTTGATFVAVNLAALSVTLIEAELFGHRRGAFTGAHADRQGFLEECAAGGVIFLDEIGELDATLQVKLLRVLQNRNFQRIGETQERRFLGKIVAATNRDLVAEMRLGRFRADFYYRLCADVIVTPRLAEQLADSPGDVANLIQFVAEHVATPELAPELAAEVLAFVAASLPRGYEWPGNFRELEQCVRNIMVRGRYQPPVLAARTAVEDLVDGLREASLSADEIAGRYFALVFRRAGSLTEAARRLGTDSRTVKARMDRDFLARLG